MGEKEGDTPPQSESALSIAFSPKASNTTIGRSPDFLAFVRLPISRQWHYEKRLPFRTSRLQLREQLRTCTVFPFNFGNQLQKPKAGRR